MTDPIPPAAKAAYQAWQKARGVPEAPGGDCGWSVMVSTGAAGGWESAVMAASPVLRAAERQRIRNLLAGDQMADHAPIESMYGLSCRTCVAWQDDEGEHEFGIAIPEQWPCPVARALEVSSE